VVFAAAGGIFLAVFFTAFSFWVNNSEPRIRKFIGSLRDKNQTFFVEEPNVED